jgi:hypothetical protein
LAGFAEQLQGEAERPDAFFQAQHARIAGRLSAGAGRSMTAILCGSCLLGPAVLPGLALRARWPPSHCRMAAHRRPAC